MGKNKEIEKRVYEKFPVSKKEKECEGERSKREYMRDQFRKELKQQQGKEKREY